MTKIVPTIGRKVWYRPGPDDEIMTVVNKDLPFDATVVCVINDALVHLVIFDHHGYSHRRFAIPVVNEGEPKPTEAPYVEWMPYQIGQAKKHEQPLPEMQQGAGGMPFGGQSL